MSRFLVKLIIFASIARTLNGICLNLIFVVKGRFRFHINIGSEIKTVTVVTAQL